MSHRHITEMLREWKLVNLASTMIPHFGLMHDGSCHQCTIWFDRELATGSMISARIVGVDISRSTSMIAV
ncbi:hypothetical protein GOP47_0003855 [Adiantum capillus-veneris]|uniref:Uncharacterized protein n=1 Tax=Adiantum capillus-veneris TaxID=13818 RepID=A0A9D4V725_ADICA|nr:hypothetical protein GOP47_0003855 [Adiantum capillus-veneris]